MFDEEEQVSFCFSAVTIAAHEVLDVLARYRSSCNKNVRMSLSDITPSNSLLGLVTTSPVHLCNKKRHNYDSCETDKLAKYKDVNKDQ